MSEQYSHFSRLVTLHYEHKSEWLQQMTFLRSCLCESLERGFDFPNVLLIMVWYVYWMHGHIVNTSALCLGGLGSKLSSETGYHEWFIMVSSVPVDRCWYSTSHMTSEGMWSRKSVVEEPDNLLWTKAGCRLTHFISLHFDQMNCPYLWLHTEEWNVGFECMLSLMVWSILQIGHSRFLPHLF